MAYTALTAEQIATKRGITNTLMEQIKDDLDYLYSKSSSVIDIVNGSFEIDADADGVPDNWTGAAFSGGTIGLETTSPIEGAASVKMVHPGGSGNGGGYYLSDYVPCSSVRPFLLTMLHYSTAAGMKNQLYVYWYDESKTALTGGNEYTLVYESTHNPTSAAYFIIGCEPPADAKFFKVKIIGGYTDTDVAGTAYFDAISILPTPFRTTINNPSMAAISQGTTTSTSWVDSNSCTLTCPFKNLPVYLIFTGKLASGTALTDVYQRFRVGSDYSNEENTQTNYPSFESFTYTILTTNDEGDISLIMQLKSSSGGTTAYGKKDAGAGKYRIDTDNVFI